MMRNWREAVGCLLLALVGVHTANAQGVDRIWLNNTMREPMLVFIKSEHRANWTRVRVGGLRKAAVTFSNPDNYEIITRDPEGGEFASGPLQLRYACQFTPDMVIDLDGERLVRTVHEQRYSWRWRRWYRVERQVSERAAIIYYFNHSNGYREGLRAPPSW